MDSEILWDILKFQNWESGTARYYLTLTLRISEFPKVYQNPFLVKAKVKEQMWLCSGYDSNYLMAGLSLITLIILYKATNQLNFKIGDQYFLFHFMKIDPRLQCYEKNVKGNNALLETVFFLSNSDLQHMSKCVKIHHSFFQNVHELNVSRKQRSLVKIRLGLTIFLIYYDIKWWRTWIKSHPAY